MVALIVFIIATLKIVFGRKKLFDAKGRFGDNVIKIRLDNPAKGAALMPNGLKPRLPHANDTL